MGFPSPIQLYDINIALSKFVDWFELLFQVSDMAYVRLDLIIVVLLLQKNRHHYANWTEISPSLCNDVIQPSRLQAD